MSRARPCNAPRNLLVAAVTAALALPLSAAHAEDRPKLLLPFMAALWAEGRAPTGSGSTARSAPSRTGLLKLLPSQLQVPDGYAEDPYAPPPRFAAPVDSSRFVSFDLFRRARRGWMASLAYDGERRGPLAGSSDLLSVVIEYRF